MQISVIFIFAIMAALIGNIGEYDSSKEDVVAYLERFDLFLSANDIVDAAKKRSVFLSTVGPQTYKLIRSLANNKPLSLTFEQLCELLRGHLQPRPNVIAQRYKFYKRDRLQNETVTEYLAALNSLSEFCDFGEKLDEYVRDRLVCGIGNERILQKLLSIRDLTLKTATDNAIAIEAACRDTREIQGSKVVGEQVDGTIHRVGEARRECFRCGGTRHLADTCSFKNKECFGCKKTGHTKKMCKSQHKNQSKSSDGKKNCNQVVVESEGEEVAVDSLDTWSLYRCSVEEQVDREVSPAVKNCKPACSLKAQGVRRSDPVVVTVKLNGQKVAMELDTGAAVTVMSLSAFERVGSVEKLKSTSLKLRTYTGELVRPAGVGQVDVEYEGQVLVLPVTVVKGNVPTLLGRDWLTSLRLNWADLFPAEAEVRRLAGNGVSELLAEFPTVFTDKLGCLKGYKVHVPVPDSAEPKYFKARSVPYSMRARVEEELDRLEKQGVWNKVAYSRWAAPIVPVLKDSKDPDGPVRICGDYKLTVNQCAPLDNYPIPNVRDQLAMLSGGQKFSKLDLSQAYQQLELDESTRELLTISTHKGLYQPSRLQFGVHSATGIFQRVMDQKLAGIPNVYVRVDDILVTGKDDEEHIDTLRRVLQALCDAGLTVKLSKCAFMQDSVVYCGYLISSSGVHPMASNVEAVAKAPVPTNLTELRAFLGMVNYYHGFLDKLATVTEPLHNLLRKGVKWDWTISCNEAFGKLKKMLSEAPVLTHFDPTKPIVVHCDASPYGLGCVLSHVMPDGLERPVSFVSRTLSAAERNYAHIEKEGLALVFAVKKFHEYLYGQEFTMVTDHKPLLGLFSEQKGLPSRSSARVLRWALLLAAYNYKLMYRPGPDHANADGLSRLPLDFHPTDVSSSVFPVRMLEMQSAPVNEKDVRVATRRDPVLSKLLCCVLKGWSSSSNVYPELEAFKLHADELSTESGCVLWGSRVVIPEVLRERVLNMLHEVHPGMSRMKALARCYVWWPGMDKQIENLVRCCATCKEHQTRPAGAPVHPWEHPTSPWQRVHIDFAGPMKGETFLLLVDAYSKWLEVVKVKSVSSQNTICELRKIFATHGLPEMIVSDNGTAFTSQEFSEFLSRNGVVHVKTAPYHPSSNGQVERYVATFKSSFKSLEGTDTDLKLSRLLFHYRTTPHSATGVSPAEKLMKRRLRTPMDQLKSSNAQKVRAKDVEQRAASKLREFAEGEHVLIMNFSSQNKCKWLPGVVVKRLGSTNYEVQLDSGEKMHRHIDQLLSNETNGSSHSIFGRLAVTDSALPSVEERVDARVPDEQAPAAEQSIVEPSVVSVHEDELPVDPEPVVAEPDSPIAVEPRRSTRERRRPAYLKDYE